MSSSDIKNYLNNSSPISRLQNSSKIPLKQIHNSIDLKLTLMTDHSKNYETPKNKIKRTKLLSSTSNCNKKQQINEFSQIKASSIIYNIPQLSPPQINFQISDQLRLKINQIKDDIVTKLPTIKSSQFSSNKLQSLFSRRTVLKDLQDWLQIKLKNPPLTYQDSIEYKNMIMGVGMKQVIRLIGTRCAEQANIVNQIWELTWSICRQIILHLSKRAHKCQKILQEEATFFRNGCQSKIKDSESAIKFFKAQNLTLKERSDKLASDLSKLKKKNKQLKLIKLNLEGANDQLRQEFEVTFKQNLLLHLRMAPNDHQRRQWVKRKYASLINSNKKNNALFKKFLDSVLIENNLQLDAQQINDLTLTADLNQFKLQQNKRKFNIEKQLQEKFKTNTNQTQTIVIQKIDCCTEPIKTQTISVQVETITKRHQEVGVGTQNNYQNGTVVKNKSKRVTTKKSSQKKKDQLKSKLKQKISLNIEITKQQQNQDQTSQKQELSKTVSIQKKLEQTQILNMQVQIQKIHQIQNCVKIKTNKVQMEKQIQQIKEQIEIQMNKNEIQRIVQIGQQKMNNDNASINKLIYQNRQKNQILERMQQSVINKIQLKENGKQQRKQMQQNMQELRILFIEKEKQYNYQLQKMNKQLSKKVSAIALLNQRVTSLDLQLKLQKQKQRIQQKQQNIVTERTDSIMEDDQFSNVIRLLKQKNYKELIKQIKIKARIDQQESAKQNIFNHLNRSEIQNQPENKGSHKNKLSLQYQYVKKNVNPNMVEQAKKSSLHSNYDFGQQNQYANENRKQKGSLMDSVKVSRRASNKSVDDMNFNMNNFANQSSERQEPKILLNTLKFVEYCHEYYYQSLMTISQSNGNTSKQAGISDYNKRVIRDQYREIYRQVMEGQHGERNQKQMRTVVDKAINSLLKQLCKQVQTAQKQSLQKIEQTKINYSPMPILMANRFNLNFGVKKVASKHIKDLLICLKGIKKYTQKYEIISYFMLYSPSLSASNPILDYQDSELFFFYIFLISILDGMYADHIMSSDQIDRIGHLAKKYLASDNQFIQNISNLAQIMKVQNNSTFINFYKKLILSYKDLYSKRINDMQMIYTILRKQVKQNKWGIRWQDFVEFVSIFDDKLQEQIQCSEQEVGRNWHSVVLNSMIQIMLQDKTNENGIISQQCYIKFVVKCPQFNLDHMTHSISSIIPHNPVDIALQATQQQIMVMCQGWDLLQNIAKHVFESQNITQACVQFWVGYIKLFLLESHTNQIIDCLLTGVLNPRAAPIILRSSLPVQYQTT